MAKRNRIIYASQSVWADGEILYRVQTLGSTTTFANEDIFELGRLDIVDVVDDVPAVAVTLDTNEWGDVKQMAILAKVDTTPFDSSATSSSNLTVVSGTTEIDYYNGVALADFAVECGDTPGVAMWAPVQDECDIGTDSNDIDMTMFMDEVFVNRIEFNYAIGANYEENYGLETDIKKWFLNDGRYVNFDTFTITGTEIGNGFVTLTIASGTCQVVTMSDGNVGFLKTTDLGEPGLKYYDSSAGEWIIYPVTSGSAQQAGYFTYDSSNNRLYLPTDTSITGTNDVLQALYAADCYGTQTADQYFKLMSESPDETNWRPDGLGAIRQGQAEIYLVDTNTPSYELALRLTSVRITCDLTREMLYEIGHLRPYDRPLRLPIPVTVAVETTAGDLETWAKFAGKETEYDAGTLYDIDIIDLMRKDNLKLVAMIYYQTDEEAGGTGANRKVDADSELVGKYYWNQGAKSGSVYSGGDREYPLKTIVCENLKITDEAYTLGIKGNATQTFTFRFNNDLYAIQGYVPIMHITGGNKIRRNA